MTAPQAATGQRAFAFQKVFKKLNHSCEDHILHLSLIFPIDTGSYWIELVSSLLRPYLELTRSCT